MLDLFYDYKSNIALYPDLADLPARAPAPTRLRGANDHLLHRREGSRHT